MYVGCAKSSKSLGFIEAHKRYFAPIMLASKAGPGIYEYPVGNTIDRTCLQVCDGMSACA